MWRASYGVGNYRLNNNFKIFLLPVRGSIAKALLEVLRVRDKLGSGLCSCATGSSHNYDKLPGSRVQNSPNNRKITTFAGRVHRVHRPYSSGGSLFLNVEFPIVFDKTEVKVFSQVHRPAVIECAHHYRWRITQILERVVGADSDLAWLTDLPEQTGETHARICIANRDAVLGIRNDIAPLKLFSGIEWKRMIISFNLSFECSWVSSRVPFVQS